MIFAYWQQVEAKTIHRTIHLLKFIRYCQYSQVKNIFKGSMVNFSQKIKYINRPLSKSCAQIQVSRAQLFKYQFYFYIYCVDNFVSQLQWMEGKSKNQSPKNCKKPRKKVKVQAPSDQIQNKKQSIDSNEVHSQSDDSSSSSGWSSEVIEPAIKTMSYRTKRGTRMKDLIKGKHQKDQFWEKYQTFFGGDLNKPDEDLDEEDYQASSSGRDDFDSDFDLTDSYVGKRGRKKGTKVKRRKKAPAKVVQQKNQAQRAPKGRRGRKRKVPETITQPLANPLQKRQPLEDENLKKQIQASFFKKQKFEEFANGIQEANEFNQYFCLQSPIRRCYEEEEKPVGNQDKRSEIINSKQCRQEQRSISKGQ